MPALPLKAASTSRPHPYFPAPPQSILGCGARQPFYVHGSAAGRCRRTGFNQNVRPNDSRLDVNGRDLGDADADFVAAEPRPFMPGDRLVRHLDNRGEQQITARPPARLKFFRWHGVTEHTNQSISPGRPVQSSPVNHCLCRQHGWSGHLLPRDDCLPGARWPAFPSATPEASRPAGGIPPDAGPVACDRPRRVPQKPGG